MSTQREWNWESSIPSILVTQKHPEAYNMLVSKQGYWNGLTEIIKEVI